MLLLLVYSGSYDPWRSGLLKKIVNGLILDLKEQTTQKQAPGGVGLMKKINSSKRKTKEGGTWGRPHL